MKHIEAKITSIEPRTYGYYVSITYSGIGEEIPVDRSGSRDGESTFTTVYSEKDKYGRTIKAKRDCLVSVRSLTSGTEINYDKTIPEILSIIKNAAGLCSIDIKLQIHSNSIHDSIKMTDILFENVDKEVDKLNRLHRLCIEEVKPVISKNNEEYYAKAAQLNSIDIPHEIGTVYHSKYSLRIRTVNPPSPKPGHRYYTVTLLSGNTTIDSYLIDSAHPGEIDDLTSVRWFEHNAQHTADINVVLEDGELKASWYAEKTADFKECQDFTIIDIEWE